MIQAEFQNAALSLDGCQVTEPHAGVGTKAGLAVGANPFLELKFEFTSLQPDQHRESAAQIVTLLSALSSRYGVDWSIGHQMERELGKVVGGIPDPDLLAELETSIHVASSLAEIMIDDEFVDDEATDLSDDESDHDLDEEAEDSDHWSSLMNPSETFKRFPKFDEEQETHDF